MIADDNTMNDSTNDCPIDIMLIFFKINGKHTKITI